MYINIKIYILKKCTLLFLYLITFLKICPGVFGTGVIVGGICPGVFVRGVFVQEPLDTYSYVYFKLKIVR